MSAIKDGRFPIELGGKPFHLLFSLNVLEEMQEHFGGLDNVSEVMNGAEGMKNVKWLLSRAINEGTTYTHFVETGKTEGAELLDEKIIGLLLNAGNVIGLKTEILNAFAFAVHGGEAPPKDEAGGIEENNEGNPEAGKV